MMLGFGVSAWFLEENGFPVAPAILGMRAGQDARRELHHLDDQVRRPAGSPSSSARSPPGLALFMLLVWVGSAPLPCGGSGGKH